MRNTEFSAGVWQACLDHGLLCTLNHLRGEIYSDHPAFWADLVSSQDDVYTAAAAEIHNHVAGLKIGEAGGIATTPGEVGGDLWY